RRLPGQTLRLPRAGRAHPRRHPAAPAPLLGGRGRRGAARRGGVVGDRRRAAGGDDPQGVRHPRAVDAERRTAADPRPDRGARLGHRPAHRVEPARGLYRAAAAQAGGGRRKRPHHHHSRGGLPPRGSRFMRAVLRRTRVRLTAAYSALFILLAAVVSTAFYVAYARSQYASTDSELTERVQALINGLELDASPVTFDKKDAVPDGEQGEVSAIMLRLDGQVQDTIGSKPVTPRLAQALLRRRPTATTPVLET